MWALLALMNSLLFCQMQQGQSLKPKREGADSRSLAALPAGVQGCPFPPPRQQEGPPKGSPQQFAEWWGLGHTAASCPHSPSSFPSVLEGQKQQSHLPCQCPGPALCTQAAGRQNVLWQWSPFCSCPGIVPQLGDSLLREN